jgi:uncharacterized protein YbjT (DUF2867 family)
MTDDVLASVRRLNTKTSCSGVILITGASGRVARRTAELLARDGHGLRLMTRSPERAPLLAAGETVRGDFAEPATLKDAFAGVGTALVVSASGEPGDRARLQGQTWNGPKR